MFTVYVPVSWLILPPNWPVFVDNVPTITRPCFTGSSKGIVRQKNISVFQKRFVRMKAVVFASGCDRNEFDAVVKYVIFLSVAA